MASWVKSYKEDIMFVVSLLGGVALVTVGLVRNDAPTILLGAGALGVPGFNTAAKGAPE